MDVSYTHYTDETNNVSMNDYGNVSTNSIHLYYCQTTLKMYLQEQNMNKKDTESV